MLFQSTPKRVAAAPESGTDVGELERYLQALLEGELSRAVPRLRDSKMRAIAELIEKFARQQAGMLINLSLELNQAVYDTVGAANRPMIWQERIGLCGRT